MRGTTRDPARAPAIEAAGVEPHVGDPDRVATLVPAFEHVTIACVLLGSAAGPADQVEALHGSRLEMLLSRMLDTTIRAVLYETSGSIDPELLAGGAGRVRAACEDARIPYLLLDADRDPPEQWVGTAHRAVSGLIGAAEAVEGPIERG